MCAKKFGGCLEIKLKKITGAIAFEWPGPGTTVPTFRGLCTRGDDLVMQNHTTPEIP